tara:strand:- start:25190 stop:25618 length:429 start_codon:yes stop_codon:yes gene_type:complete
MPLLVAHLTNNSAPLTSPAQVPTIRVRRLSDNALVVTDAAMTEVGDGSFVYDMTTVGLLEYSFRVDADPTAADQVTARERYQYGVLGNDILRKTFLNRAVTTENAGPAPPAGSKTIDFYDEDGVTVIETLLISADGLERTNV